MYQSTSYKFIDFIFIYYLFYVFNITVYTVLYPSWYVFCFDHVKFIS